MSRKDYIRAVKIIVAAPKTKRRLFREAFEQLFSDNKSFDVDKFRKAINNGMLFEAQQLRTRTSTTTT